MYEKNIIVSPANSELLVAVSAKGRREKAKSTQFLVFKRYFINQFSKT